MARELAYADIKVGDRAELSKQVTDADIMAFATVTGDFNPVHVNEEYAKKTQFGGRIAHGMLTAGLVSAVLGMKLPGANAIYMKQELAFLGPVRIGDTVTAAVEVIEKVDEKHRVILRTSVTNQDGKLILDGKATLMKK
ncbi:MAG TPA: MaoC family dehydratase [Candidatus Ozemobacteraceae bacterium]|nr:MaoC family dehydratase [Candidatus Ozemobacteraceae bacterium]